MSVKTAAGGGRSVLALVSGGLDSAVLLATLANDFARVHPVYIRAGLVWERTERAWLSRFLAALSRVSKKRTIKPLVLLDLPVRDLQPGHWSLTGRRVPGARSADREVYLPGRNILLLSKAAVRAAAEGISRIAIGTLAGNPFPDATPRFFDRLASALSVGLDFRISIEAPFAALKKSDLIAMGRNLPLGFTFSCIAPVGRRHCGRCNKCAERIRAFAAAGVADPTRYAEAPLRR